MPEMLHEMLATCHPYDGLSHGNNAPSSAPLISERALVSLHIPMLCPFFLLIWGADMSLARPTSRCILFDGENISFDSSLVIQVYINSTNIPPIMITNRIYEYQNLLSL
jgi:hypothetical protein